MPTGKMGINAGDNNILWNAVIQLAGTVAGQWLGFFFNIYQRLRKGTLNRTIVADFNGGRAVKLIFAVLDIIDGKR